VQDDDERVVAPSVQIAAEIEDLELVGDVQEGGGLVEEKQRGLLSQDEGEPGALALTAGELVHPAMGETRDPGGAHGRLDGGVVLLRPLPEHALIGESPPAGEVADGDGGEIEEGGAERGARQAVEQMKAEGVEGIVMASSGSHVQGAVTAAKEYHIPMIEVYDNVGTGDGVWSFAPNAEASLVALQSGVEDPNKVVAVEAQGYSTGILAAHTLTYKPGDDPAALARTVAEKTAELGPGTTVTVAAPAAMQASIVKALQEAAVKTTILLSPQAISPVFSTELVKQGGAISSSLATSGVDTSDSVALQSTDEGRSMSTFLKAVGIMSADPNVQTLSGDQEFSTVAAYADSRSHDAVVALAYASALNLDMNNESVLKTLATVKMRSGEGLAGPALDFTRPNAVTAQPALLHASEQSLGLRPQTAGSAADASITWFAG